MIEVFLLIILFILSAFFSASETALTSLSKIRLNRMIEHNVRGARLIERLKKQPAELLSTILIGNNLVNIAAASLATSISIELLSSWGWGNMGTAVGVATGVMTFLVLVFGEITPKTVALRNPEKFSLFVAPIIVFLQVVLRPFAYFIGFISRPFIYLLGGKAPQQGPFITEDEIKLILAAGEKEGVIEEEEREMITSIFEFGETVVREVMTPRPDITAVDVAAPVEDVIKIIIESGHSRIPIFEGNLDNILGFVYAKDLLQSQKGKAVRELLRKATFIPETKKVPELLHEMQSARTHSAIIVDEYGITSGLVTLEDLIEEIVGEIHDEFERDERKIEKVDTNAFIVNGLLSTNDLNDELGLNLPEKEYDSVGGFVFGKLGKAPAVGNVVRYENLLISVERVYRRRITRVKIVILPNKLGEESVGG